MCDIVLDGVSSFATYHYREERDYQLNAFSRDPIAADAVKASFERFEQFGLLASQDRLTHAVGKELVTQLTCTVITVGLLALMITRYRKSIIAIGLICATSSAVDAWSAAKRHQRIPVLACLNDLYGRLAFHLTGITMLVSGIILITRLRLDNDTARIVLLPVLFGGLLPCFAECKLRNQQETNRSAAYGKKEEICQLLLPEGRSL